MHDPALWQRIHAYSPDKVGVDYPFSRRLAREMGWSRQFALQAIEEYRRFMYLACIGQHPVTPSPTVDAVWHLHLIYTRSYWDDFCGQVLQKPLHHAPTEGGKAEGDKFNDWYNRTLKTYALEFNAPPPPNIWPPADIRFKPRREQWIDLDRFWVIKRWF
jgi:hypothetical protein